MRRVLVAAVAVASVVGSCVALPGLATAAPAGPVVPVSDAGPAPAARVVAPSDCRRIDPNLVRGVCLRYTVGRHRGLTWLGTYRAPSGRVFFCIDYLYDSRLPRRAELRSTDDLVNQLGEPVGDAEVAALNYVVSRWAGRGSTGSAARDAAIALIVREVMSDGTGRGGLVVYPGGLEVGGTVRPPAGGLPGPVVPLAQQMWTLASRDRGPYALALTTRASGPVRLGRVRAYRVSVTGAAGRRVPGVRVELSCTGPVRCPEPVVTRRHPVRLTVKPRELGRFRIRATATGPGSDGRLYVAAGWHTHPGATARDAGVQRGWIAGRSRTTAVVRARAEIRRARPRVVTETSDVEVMPGAAIHDRVVVSGVPRGYDATATAFLYGPFAEQPGAGDCVGERLVGQVSFEVARAGRYATPALVVEQPGYYTWVVQLPGDRHTLPVTTTCGLVPETTRVVRATPAVSTVASTQRAYVGARLRDTVRVTGVGAHPLTVQWTLHGPVPPHDGSCDGLTWAGAPVAGRGAIEMPGDGTILTPPVRVTAGGCYTFSEHLPATAYTEPATSLPGQPLETVVVDRRTPRVHTVASRQHALVGATIHDRVVVRGLPDWVSVAVRWRLHGPLAPRPDGSCDRLDWTGAPVLDSGVFVARDNGSHLTGRTRLEVSGCYTYSERLAATASTVPVVSEPGQPLETALVTRPAVPYIPEVPTGPAPAAPSSSAASPLRPVALDGDRARRGAVVPTARAVPRHLVTRYRSAASLVSRSAGGTLSLPSVGISAAVDGVGLDRGTMAIPNDPRRVGWLDRSAAADDLVGASVISGHVSSRTDRPGALWRLRGVRVGDRVQWTADGRTHTFEVTGVRRHPRATGLPADLFRTDGRRTLHLITCARRVRRGGGFHYADNLVVTARAM